jgi:PAS domain S-box-containing protein
MPENPTAQEQLLAENEDLRARLDEAEETVRAIRSGEVDALVVSGAGGAQVFTLKGADHAYRVLVEEMNEGALTLTAEGLILYANRRFAEMLKTPLETVIGSVIHTWIAPADQGILRALLGRDDAQTRREEVTLLAGDATAVPAHLSINRLQTEEMLEPICVVATDLTMQKRTEEIAACEKLARDLLLSSNQSNIVLLSVIEDQKMAETALQENEAMLRGVLVNLERSNKELEQFAYVASHDLQEPLRMIGTYVQLLEQEYKGKFDEEADRWIHYIVEGANRMKDLLHDLLAFSRIGTQCKPSGRTNCADVLRDAAANLGPAIEEARAEITWDALPIVMADGVQFTQLFQNLVGNAVKFHGTEAPRVHVGAVRKDDVWLFSVRDNGIGIEERHAERIFTIFQRLHTREEYPGSGIGLAICRKIVDRHGGRIWVESCPGEGSTFYFTWPTAMDAEFGQGNLMGAGEGITQKD